MKIDSNKLLPIFKYHADEYCNAVIKVLNSGYYILGPDVKAFELNFAKYFNAKYCVGLANGLDALEIALRAYDLYNIDAEIIVPSNTYIATVLAITKCNLKPIFVEPNEFYNIDVDKIEKKITKKTKAVMSVNLYGQSCNMKKLREICDKHHLLLIEDSAQSHGAKYDGKYTNEYSDISCYSFYPSKNLGAFGDGGAVLLNDDEIYNKIKAIRNYGSHVRYYNRYQGMNSRLDELQAALLSVKLTYFDEILCEREKLANYYLNNISNSKILLPKIQDKSNHVWHLFIIRTKERDKFIEYMKENDIQILIHYPVPPHLQECYKCLGYRIGDFKIAEEYANTIATLPLYNGMTESEQKYVVDCINKF